MQGGTWATRPAAARGEVGGENIRNFWSLGSPCPQGAAVQRAPGPGRLHGGRAGHASHTRQVPGGGEELHHISMSSDAALLTLLFFILVHYQSWSVLAVNSGIKEFGDTRNLNYGEIKVELVLRSSSFISFINETKIVYLIQAVFGKSNLLAKEAQQNDCFSLLQTTL